MWKLDLLEAKFEDVSPRYPHTKKLLFALNHNNKLAKKLPTTKAEAQEEIRTLKARYFEQKYHSGYTKLDKEVKKFIKQKEAPDVFVQDDFIQQLITAKLIKCIASTVLTSKQLKTNPPQYIPSNIGEYITDKSSPFNPSHFFVQYCQNSKEVNNYCSNLWNSKAVKSIMNDIEWSFKMVRGNLSKQDFEERRKQTGKTVDDDNSDAEDESASEEDSKEDADKESENEDRLSAFDGMVAESDQDDDDDNNGALDPNINYNEVTDEEPSEAASDESDSNSDSGDDFFEEEPPKKKLKTNSKDDYNLPELAQGYYSGGSDDESDDVDNDEVVKSITQQRKNRRGQRARQKIWAQKYGKEAKHIVKDRERIQSERETRQREYEERQRKRELKAQLLAEKQQPTGANTEPLGERKARSSVTPPTEDKKIHPSWEAKKLAEEKLKNVKFQGKKITFD
ncbi:BUD22 [Candida margitis]|uniref:BUD22 n=1 Tax=Candida margitis TaxID=1775924 RepID=UPI002226ABE2|nr:BUD22 [Candida margitis]KAI5967724.1 BUD22 [Candida margitis]